MFYNRGLSRLLQQVAGTAYRSRSPSEGERGRCHRRTKKVRPTADPSLSIKSIFREFSVSRGSAHEIDFAKQNHKNREHGPGHPLLPLCGNSPCVSRFLYSKREKVSAWELSDVRVLRSQNTDCRKNEVFRQAQVRLTADPSIFRTFLSSFYSPRKFLALIVKYRDIL